MSRGVRWSLNLVLVLVGVFLWFLFTRGWDEYGLWLSWGSAIVFGLVQLFFWIRFAGRRNPDVHD